MSAQPRLLHSRVSRSAILKLAQLVSADAVALERWEVIMHHLVRRPAALRDLRNCETELKVLKTLQLWRTEQGPAATFERFCNLLRDEFNLVLLTNEIFEYVNTIDETEEIESCDEISEPDLETDRDRAGRAGTDLEHNVTLRLTENGDDEVAPPPTHGNGRTNIFWRWFKLRVPRMIPYLSGFYGLSLLIYSSRIVHDWREIFTQCIHKYVNATETEETDSAPDACRLPYNFVLGGACGIIAGILQLLFIVPLPKAKMWVLLQLTILVYVLLAFYVPVSSGAFSVQNSYLGFKVRKTLLQSFLTWAIFDFVSIVIFCVIVCIWAPPLFSQEAIQEFSEEFSEIVLIKDLLC